MYKKGSIFNNNESKMSILTNIYYDTLNGKTDKEIADNYGYSARQIKYIRDHYLNIKKPKGGYKKNMDDEKLVKIDDNNFIIGGKCAKKATVEDLMEKAKEIKRKNKNTNKKVENNK